MHKAFPLLLMIALCSSAAAQIGGATLRIAVMDSGDLPLPGVVVTMTQAEKGLHFSAITDEMGTVVFPAVPPGSYVVKASPAAFKETSFTVEAAAGSWINLSIEMEIQDSKHSCFSEDTTPGILDTNAEGIRLDTETINAEIPVERETTYLGMLAPGSVPGAAIFDGGSPGQRLLSYGGASVAENSYRLNGLDITNFRTGLGSTIVPMEFVDQVEIRTGGWDASLRGGDRRDDQHADKIRIESFSRKLFAVFRT